MTSIANQPNNQLNIPRVFDSNVPDELNFSQICRICGALSEQVIPLYRPDAENILVQRINQYLPVVVTRQDARPLVVCITCRNTVLNWHQLVMLCRKTELKLAQYVNENKLQNDSYEKFQSKLPQPPYPHQEIQTPNSQEQQNVNTSVDNERILFNTEVVKTETSNSKDRCDGEAPDPQTENIERPQVVVIENGKRYGVCAVCDKRVPTASWRRHWRSHRAGARYRCHACGLGFSDGANLARHARALHRRLRPHACPLCRRTFARRAHLRDHVEAHSERRDYVCDVCGKASKSGAALRMHRRVHDERRAFRCAQCGKAFRRRGQLRAHASVHSGERAHACACGRAFRLRAQLAAHQRRHLRAPACDVAFIGPGADPKRD